ncbi:aldehyde dehydrogenase family protein [Pontibacillus yanchengensis]|uniref:Aldehyde dehydrogenase family protein n=2 Tax=Pontibacillus yanchengensis TaxID=462910 RepID=A0ACC7VER9_9BACI|nr:aldehyde dehydrogenase family protein [Pontibacillus yanchengensis]MYL32519.1 aldehyde dehydrogenase family protein [Pontibacillus yanchengensis]MYL53100.1 aldehyde dehydrogenase family protein [Pontibacillus yanchengensis]
MSEHYGLFINGKWIQTQQMNEVVNKYDGDVFATVSKAGDNEVENAIHDAEVAFANKEFPPYQRYKTLLRVSELLQAHKEDLAQVITNEAGKPIKQARTEIDRATQTFELSAEEAKRITGEGVPVEAAPGSENRMAFTMRVPVGVVGAISPFNFPVNLVAHKIAPAIAAGNAVVLKPASATPVSSLKLAELFEEAGLPEGFLNVVVGSGSTVGNQMMEDERINYYTFTGSAEVGLKLKQNTGLNKLTLELGNNSPVIVDREADVEQAATTLAQKSFAYAGQVCISVQRIYVHEDIQKTFQKKFIEATEELKVGDPFDDQTDVGPMIGEKEAEGAEEWLQEAKGQGADVIHGGKRKGAILEPTIVANVEHTMKVVSEEVFAPIVTLMTFSDLDQCISEVNKSDYGLQGGIFTNDIDRAFKAARKVEVGGFMINDASQYRVDLMPYGGVKNSGWGKEGPKYTINDMTEERLVVMNLKQ